VSNSKIGCGLIQLFFQHSIRGQDPHQSPALRVKINIRSACSIARQQVGLDKARKFSTSPIYACERHSYILKISLDNQFPHHCSGASLAGTTNPDNKIRRPGESFIYSVIKHWVNTVHGLMQTARFIFEAATTRHIGPTFRVSERGPHEAAAGRRSSDSDSCTRVTRRS
jgi:hypothetical protein